MKEIECNEEYSSIINDDERAVLKLMSLSESQGKHEWTRGQIMHGLSVAHPINHEDIVGILKSLAEKSYVCETPRKTGQDWSLYKLTQAGIEVVKSESKERSMEAGSTEIKNLVESNYALWDEFSRLELELKELRERLENGYSDKIKILESNNRRLMEMVLDLRSKSSESSGPFNKEEEINAKLDKLLGVFFGEEKYPGAVKIASKRGGAVFSLVSYLIRKGGKAKKREAFDFFKTKGFNEKEIEEAFEFLLSNDVASNTLSVSNEVVWLLVQ